MPEPLPPLSPDAKPNDDLLADFLDKEDVGTREWDAVAHESWRDHPLSSTLANVDTTLASLTRLGIPQDRIDQVRQALRNMNRMPEESFWRTAPELLQTLGDRSMTKQRAEVILDIFEQAAKHPDARIDFGRLKNMDQRTLTEFRDLARTLDRLGSLQEAGISAETQRALREQIHQSLAGQPRPECVRQLTDAIGRLQDKNFVSELGESRLKSIIDMMKVQAENPHLNIPIEHFFQRNAQGQLPSPETVRFAADRFNEARNFAPPHRNTPDGIRHEFNASMAAQQQCATPFRNGERFVYIPNTHGSQADGHGVDGVFLNPQTGEIKPVDWTLDIEGKRASGHALYAVQAEGSGVDARSMVGNRVPGLPQTNPDAQFRGVLETAVGRLPTTDVSNFRVSDQPGRPGQVTFPSLATELDPTRSTSAQSMERFNNEVSRMERPDRVISHMAERGVASIPAEKVKKGLAGRLAFDIGQALELDARGRGPAVARPPLTVRSDRNGSYVELPLGSRLENSGHPESVRIYADGTVVWAKDKPNVKPIECFHIAEIDGQIRQRLNQIPDATQRQAALAALDTLTSASKTNPIDMRNPGLHPAIDVLSRALTRPGEFAAAAQRSSRVDDVRDRLRDRQLSDADARAVAERCPKKEKAQVYNDVYDSILLERRLPERNLTPEQSLEMVKKAREMQTRLSLTPEQALDAVALREGRGVPEGVAAAQAREMTDIRRLNPNLDFNQAQSLAKAQLEMTRLAGAAAPEFRNELRDAISRARPGHEITDIRTRMLAIAEERALGTSATANDWSRLHNAIDKMNDAAFREFLGLTPGANTAESLRVVNTRAQEAGGTAAAAPVRPADRPTETAVTPPAPPEVRPPRTGDRVSFEGGTYNVAGQQGENLVLHQPRPADAVSLDPISQADLDARYEQVRLTVDGAEQIRYMEKGHPEKGLFTVRRAAGEILIGSDPSFKIATPARVTAAPVVASAPPVAPGPTPATPDRVAAKPPTPVERPAPELPAPPTADRLVGTEIVVNRDGTLRLEDVRIGESITLERLREQRELSGEQIRFIEDQAERLKKSDKAEEKARGEELGRIAQALKGEFGPEARAGAHATIIENTRRELERRRGGGGGPLGPAVGLGILVTAALGWYISEQHRPTSPLRRPTVGGT